ncbi:MAG: hypothetical protein HKN07_07770 [Acidimicrobiia bacterium]|nr:hypothetical protein [Acidimicrobiia bacterium]RZV42052.1 MAG: hypothetical protein EX269_15460 [Acidimicrobiales bacterium]
MILRRGADVATTDGPFGTLADVVVDPIADQLTHLVVTPSGELQLDRLVPLWLTNETDDGIRIELDNQHVKQLQRSLSDDFVRSPTPPEVMEHDVRFRTVLYHPYFVDPEHESRWADSCQGVPIKEFDVKCGSDVVSSNDRLLGSIVGFLVAEDNVHALAVRSGLVGFTHDVVVPLEAISEIVADMVLLDLDRHEFRKLRTTSVVSPGRKGLSLRYLARNTTARAWYTTRDRVRAVLVD